MSIVIAVKIGSSNTSIFKAGEGLVLFEPTLVAYNDCGSVKKVVAIGKKAKRMLGRTDGNTIIKAPIEQGRVADVELCAIMLKSYLSKVIPFSSFVYLFFRLINAFFINKAKNSCSCVYSRRLNERRKAKL